MNILLARYLALSLEENKMTTPLTILLCQFNVHPPFAQFFYPHIFIQPVLRSLEKVKSYSEFACWHTGLFQNLTAFLSLNLF